jgi:hypothetical protein
MFRVTAIAAPETAFRQGLVVDCKKAIRVEREAQAAALVRRGARVAC